MSFASSPAPSSLRKTRPWLSRSFDSTGRNSHLEVGDDVEEREAELTESESGDHMGRSASFSSITDDSSDASSDAESGSSDAEDAKEESEAEIHARPAEHETSSRKQRSLALAVHGMFLDGPFPAASSQPRQSPVPPLPLRPQPGAAADVDAVPSLGKSSVSESEMRSPPGTMRASHSDGIASLFSLDAFLSSPSTHASDTEPPITVRKATESPRRLPLSSSSAVQTGDDSAPLVISPSLLVTSPVGTDGRALPAASSIFALPSSSTSVEYELVRKNPTHQLQFDSFLSPSAPLPMISSSSSVHTSSIPTLASRHVFVSNHVAQQHQQQQQPIVHGTLSSWQYQQPVVNPSQQASPVLQFNASAPQLPAPSSPPSSRKFPDADLADAPPGSVIISAPSPPPVSGYAHFNQPDEIPGGSVVSAGGSTEPYLAGIRWLPLLQRLTRAGLLGLIIYSVFSRVSRWFRVMRPALVSIRLLHWGICSALADWSWMLAKFH